MLEEGERKTMDKKTNSRPSSVPQKTNGNETKKPENGSSKTSRYSKRRETGNYGYYQENPSRKPTPQKSRNFGDKRPRSRGGYSSRQEHDLEVDVGADYGPAFDTASKKGSLNHLLNFTYVPRDTYGVGSGGGSWSRGRQVRYRTGYSRGSKVCYNKEQFLQANCQFVVQEKGDYSIHYMDPDVLVNWDTVEQVRVSGTEKPSCPICLQDPIAAKMTRCGHIYCWACILHYLALGEKSWRKCPICYESIHSKDLKSVKVKEVRHYKVGDTITMTLMKKEKGSTYAVPKSAWEKREGQCHNVADNVLVTRHLKVLTAKPDQVLLMIEEEKQALKQQLQQAEPSEEAFIDSAFSLLKEREELLLDTAQIVSKVSKALIASEPVKQEEEVPEAKSTIKPGLAFGGSKKIKQYASAFSDEEDVEEEPPTSSAAETNKEREAPGSGNISSDDSRSSSSPVTVPVETKGEEPFSVGSPEGQPPAPMELIPDVMPVEEAAEHLELPHNEVDIKTSGKKQGSHDDTFYFYQANDGQNIFLHSLNARCLVREYGSLANSPHTVTGKIVEKESVFVTEELRKRLRYLSHLPLTCGFEVAELALKPPLISKETLKQFGDDIEKRRRQRQRKNREEKKMSRRIDEEEKKKLGLATGTIVKSQFLNVDSGEFQPIDQRSDTSSPSLDTPIGSPPALSINAGDFVQGGATSKEAEGGREQDDGHQTTPVSFAQLLKTGKKTAVWSKVGSKQEASPQASPASHRTGSDESDNEDRIPVPVYQASFGTAIQKALDNMESKSEGVAQTPQPGSGKKKKKQLVLFSTSMARGGK